MNDNDRAAAELIARARDEYRRVALRFVGDEYHVAMQKAYVRTVSDVLTVRDAINLGVSTRVLEVGAFTGIVSTALQWAGFNVTAHDLALFMRDPALQAHFAKVGVAAVEGDLRDTPLQLPTAGFDLIVCCEVIEHLNFNPLPVLRDFHRLLRSGGALYVATPNQANVVKRIAALRGGSVHDPVERFEWQLDPNATFSIGLHWREYTAMELRKLLEMCGFIIQRQGYCHYSDRFESPRWRRLLVTGMYRACPAFLPGQIAVAVKGDAANQVLDGI